MSNQTSAFSAWIAKSVKHDQVIERNVNPVIACMNVLGGKWKPVILYLVSKKINRFGLLLNDIDGISKQMLTKQLKELTKDGLLERKVYSEVPPRVEYVITEKGESLFPIIEQMVVWGSENQ